MKRYLVYLALIGAGVCQAEVPKLFTEKNFTATTLAEAANHYVAIGKAATIKELNQLARQDKSDNDSFFGNHISISERIGWVCRIVFVSDGINPLRAPQYGYLSLPNKFMPASEWPLFPVARAGSTYIILAESYTVKSTPETASHYIQYCADNGVFRSAPVAMPTKEEALKDTLAFRQSARWKNIKWEDSDGVSFPMGEQFAWAFYQNQVKLIPDVPKQNSKVMLAKQPAKPAAVSVATAAKPAPTVAIAERSALTADSAITATASHMTRSKSSGTAPMAEASVISFH